MPIIHPCFDHTESYILFQELVEKYSEKFNGDFAAIPNDGYVYWNIIDHLIEAKMVDKAVELLLSFKWIEEKLRATGAPDLINSYHKVIKLVQDDVSMLAKILFVPLEAKGEGACFLMVFVIAPSVLLLYLVSMHKYVPK